MQILLCPLEVLSRLTMAINESEDSELPGIQVYCAYQFKSIFSRDGNLLSVFTLCVKSQRIQAVERTVLTRVPMKNTACQIGDTQVREGCPEQRFMVLSDRGRTFTHTGCFKLTRWQPRLLRNAAVPTVGRILSIAKIGIQELELLRVSIAYRLLQLLSCNLSKSRNRPL